MIKKILKMFQEPEKIIIKLGKMTNLISDEFFLKAYYYNIFKEKLNLKNPQTFNEKLQWLKLYDRKAKYTTMVDKYAVKKYVANIIGEEYIIPTLGVWNHFDEIDFGNLPNQFVLKCTHDSGGLVICKDKAKLDEELAKTKLEASLKHNFYLGGREWPYKNVKRRIIAEQYLSDAQTNDLYDYKFFCFGGKVRCFKVDFDRFVEHHANYYDKEGNILKFGEADLPPIYDKNIKMSKNIEKMVKLAEKLTEKQPFLRADFYDANGKIYFGELTFFPASGFGKFTSEDWDLKLGEWIELPDKESWGGKTYIIFVNEVIVILHPKKTDSSELIDYKIHCFNGIPKFILVCSERFSKDGTKEDFFDTRWNKLPFKRPALECSSKVLRKPMHLEEMLRLSEMLSKEVAFLRCDFYEINGKVYFGELTFYPASGFEAYEPEEWDYKLGSWLELPEKP